MFCRRDPPPLKDRLLASPEPTFNGDRSEAMGLGDKQPSRESRAIAHAGLSLNRRRCGDVSITSRLSGC